MNLVYGVGGILVVFVGLAVGVAAAVAQATD